ncbi:MAG TPA: rhodanese-like domain-containing protein [Burkholderiaceae bacterium]|nr:rhodanese-like domain-containing protein [Burkholderiaceae bacterium]
MTSDYLLPAALVAFVAWRAISSWYVRRKIPELLREGAQIVDVRTPAEYAAGHPCPSRNIPLGELGDRFKELNPERWVIVCCASGSRSAIARRLLRRHGFVRVFNAGSWRRLP